MQRMEMKARAEAAQKAARTKLKNPARPLLFGILAAVLVGACILGTCPHLPLESLMPIDLQGQGTELSSW